MSIDSARHDNSPSTGMQPVSHRSAPVVPAPSTEHRIKNPLVDVAITARKSRTYALCEEHQRGEIGTNLATLVSVNGVLDSWLFCEIDGDVIASTLERLRIERCIPGSQWLFSSGNHRSLRVNAPAELIAALPERVMSGQEQLVWIDDRPAVTAALIRAGMNAVVFIDAPRLRRNLVLRGLLQ